MLKNQSESAQIMTIQNLKDLDTSAETMQDISEKGTNNAQQSSKNGHISFSVASLLADTRPQKSSSPFSASTLQSSSPLNPSSDEEYDSHQEDSIVDVEDLNSDREKSEDSTCKDNEYLDETEKQKQFHKESLLSQGPIRPTPFSALAAAVYQAAHPNWTHQGLVNPFGGPSPLFQSASPFGIPNMNASK